MSSTWCEVKPYRSLRVRTSILHTVIWLKCVGLTLACHSNAFSNNRAVEACFIPSSSTFSKSSSPFILLDSIS